jgi:lysozyme family protein
MPTFSAMAQGYRNMWRSMRITRQAAVDAAARKILSLKPRYLKVERTTGVPWFVQGIWHMRESNNNFAGVLHNGEHIIGTGRKTRLVPAGRGPFNSWEEAAEDALRMKGLHLIRDWDDIGRIGYETERFNGFGYVPRSINSPYVWAGSQHYVRGKYVADGVFSATHVDTQLGCLPVLWKLCQLDPDVNYRVNGGPAPQRNPQTSQPKPPATPRPTPVKTTSKWAGIAALVSAVAYYGGWTLAAGIGLAILGFIGYNIYKKNRKA